MGTRGADPFLKAWAWKREHRPDRDRFEMPYHHSLTSSGINETLILKQKPFTSEGFASTGLLMPLLSSCSSSSRLAVMVEFQCAPQMCFCAHEEQNETMPSGWTHIKARIKKHIWDSAIVLSKYLEKWPSLVAGKRCLELGAGCGLAGVVCAKLGAKGVILTDLPGNLPLLKENAAINKVSSVTSVEPLVWGTSNPLHGHQHPPPYDIVIATDVMYIVEAIDPLIASLLHLSGDGTKILLAYGRNRRAESLFMSKASENFLVQKVPESSLDDLYRTVDVDVHLLQLRNAPPMI